MKRGGCEEEGKERGRTGDTDHVAAITRDVVLLLSGTQSGKTHLSSRVLPPIPKTRFMNDSLDTSFVYLTMGIVVSCGHSMYV